MRYRAALLTCFLLSIVRLSLYPIRAVGDGLLSPILETIQLTNGPLANITLVSQGRPQSKRPVILTLGSLDLGHLPDWSTNLLREGFIVVAFKVDYPPDPDPTRRPVWLHFDRRFAHSYVLNGSRAPQDTKRVIDYLATREDVDLEQIGWLGSSTTGIYGLAAATAEHRIRALVAFVATGAYETWLNTWKPNGLWQDESPDLWPETRALLPTADPIHRATNLFPCAILLVNGGGDKVVDVSSTRAFVEAARPAYDTDPDRLRLVVYDGMGHNLPRDVVQLYVDHWFGMFLNPAGTKVSTSNLPASLSESTRLTALTSTPHEQLVGASISSIQTNRVTSAVDEFMPRPEDYTLIWWADGPPYFLGSRQPPTTHTLCLQSGTWGMSFDTEKMRLLRLGMFPQTMPIEDAMKPGTTDQLQLPVANWACTVRAQGRVFQCSGHATPKDEFFQPVQFVESGHFFQRILITHLQFTDDQGQLFAGDGQLEISAWPDRLSFHLSLTPKDTTEGTVDISIGQRHTSTSLATQTDLRLEAIQPPTPSVAQLRLSTDLKTSFDSALGCQVIALPEQPWSNAKGTYYPEEHLDRLDRWPIILSNDSDQPTIARIMMTQRNHLPITGLTPLLCDPDGAPTGIPVQISKNWHQRPEKGHLLHEGPWLHACTLIRLPPHSRREFTFSLAYARYGGVFAASHAQLSLVGWGHNQFWDEAAIGSFGESICFEPGRIQRRCFITDMRPLLTLPENGQNKPWGWTENCGGGDFLMWQDTDGRYRPFRATRTNYRSQGPCLTDVEYSEESEGGEIAARMSVALPRSDDYVRTFIRLRYDVRKSTRWQRLAFFQLGSDFYNETPSRQVAIGDLNGLREEWNPKLTPKSFDRQGIPLFGSHPWVSIHGLNPTGLRQGIAAASRGLIVRRWEAQLNGKSAPVPHLSSWCTEQGRGNFFTVLELCPPKDITQLSPGDFIEAELECVIFPTKPSSYYGPNEAFRTALTQAADTWRPVHREATGNALQVSSKNGTATKSFPPQLNVANDQTAELEVVGGLGYVPITFNGLSRHRGYSLWLDNERIDQSIHGNDFWQTDYDPFAQRWRMTFNVPLDGAAGKTRRLQFRPW